MAIKIILGTLAVLIGLIGYAFYIRGIFKGEVKPHAFTWSVWGILTSTALIAQSIMVLIDTPFAYGVIYLTKFVKEKRV